MPAGGFVWAIAAQPDGKILLGGGNLASMGGEDGAPPRERIGRYGASRVIMVPAGPGTGVKAGPGVREVLQACGIQNILTKVHGSTNPQNLVKATIAGLLELRTREEIQRLRGVTI